VSLAFRLLPALSSAYSLAQRSGLLDKRWFRRVYVKAYFGYKRHLEDPFEGLVRSRPDLFRGGHILDVGAHIGYTTSLFKKVVSPGFHVYAFEPDRSNLEILRETAVADDSAGVVVPVAAAVGDRDGEVDLWTNPHHPGDHRLATQAFREWAGGPVPTVAVRLWSLDGFLSAQGDPSPVAFVKIDVQGFEPAVCRGMEGLLRRCPRLVVAAEYAPRELESQGFDAAALPDFFRSRGYEVHVLDKDGSFEPARGSALEERCRRRGYLDLLMLPRGS
jgi:FkbM family methyltransferase